MKAQMVKWGNSLAVRIPQPVAQEAKLREGDALEIDAPEEGVVQILRVSKTPSLARLVSQITPENRYDEIKTGLETRNESVEW